MKLIWWGAFLLAVGMAVARADAPSETLTDRNLQQLVERQKAMLQTAAQAGKDFNGPDFKAQLQRLQQDYESLLQGNPDYAPAYASYGYLLEKVGDSTRALEILRKADALDGTIPLVKNEIGNCLAEQGKPLAAVAYYQAAIKLAPDEPLYRYQLGTLLYEARDDFIASGNWTAASLANTMHEAFRKAAELAPDRLPFAYRYAESFQDMPEPDWTEALRTWQVLEERAEDPLWRQIIILQEAKVRYQMGRPELAREELARVTLPALARQKEKLVAQYDAAPKK